MAQRFQIGDYWLSQRPGSHYWYRTWHDKKSRQTRRVSLRTADFEQAKIILAQWVAVQGQWHETSASEITLADVFQRYFNQHGQTVRNPDNQRRALWAILQRAGEITVREYTLATQERIVAGLRDAGYKDGGIKRMMGTAHAALRWAWKREIIDHVPPQASVPDSEPRERVLAMAELSALWRAADAPHKRMFLLLAVGTMARPGAVLRLTRFQCDLERGLIDLQPVDAPRTAKRNPVVPMAPTLRPWIEATRAGHLVTYHGRAITEIKGAWRRMRADAGLGKDVVPYTIRHTMATELRARGVPELEIAGVLGHTMPNVKTTGRYAKYAPDYLSYAVSAIDAVLQEMGRTAPTARPENGNLRTSYVAGAALPKRLSAGNPGNTLK